MLDFAATWRCYTEQRQDVRCDPAADVTFWETHASQYDARTAVAGSYNQTLGVLMELLEPGDTLLDAGAGTGRFALPLAPHVGAITAVDQSAAMLALLRRKADSAGITTITTVEACFEQWPAPPHDVVLAAWSLYRQVDLHATLSHLLAATRRTLIVVGSAGSNPPHRAAVEAIRGSWSETDVPFHLLVAGTLWQLGHWADTRVVHEQRHYRGATPEAVARLCAPTDATPAEVRYVADAIQPLLQPDAAGWCYTYAMPVGLTICMTDQHARPI